MLGARVDRVAAMKHANQKMVVRRLQLNFHSWQQSQLFGILEMDMVLVIFVLVVEGAHGSYYGQEGVT